MPRIVTLLELAATLKVSRRTILRRVDDGVIEPMQARNGKRCALRFDLEQVLRDLSQADTRHGSKRL